MGIAARFALSQEADANHPKGPSHDHIGSINSYEPEDFCVWLENSSMDPGTAYTRVAGTLLLDESANDPNPATPNEPNEDDWNRLDGTEDGNRLAFAGAGPTPCDELEDSLRARIELEYWVNDAGGCGGYSCAWKRPEDAYDDPVSGHVEYRYYYVTFKTSHINQTDPGPGQPKPWWHVINHETGHMLGLNDPSCVANPVNPGTTFDCSAGLTRECGSEAVKESYGLPLSVMHPLYAYGCDDDYKLPTTNDWSSVFALMGVQEITPSGNFSYQKAW